MSASRFEPPGWMTARYLDSFYSSRTAYILNVLMGSLEAPGGLFFAAQDREGRADEPAVPLLHHEYLELTDTAPLDPHERRRCRLEVHLTHTAAQIRSEAMRWFVYPVRKRMNSRRAGRSGTTETTGATPPTPEAPLWTDYLEQAASDDRPFRGR